MAQLALYLFGPPRVAVAGVERYIRRRKGVALLAYLAVTRQPHSRDALATLFWPEFDQTGARDNLRRTLSELHQTLDNNWLVIDRTTIRLRDDAELWVDLWQFHRLLAACQQHGHAEDQVCSECLPRLQQAAELYRDDFLAGFTLSDSPAFDDWQAQTTAEVRATFATTLARLVDAYVEQRDYAKAIDPARRWVALDPLHEPAHCMLMHCYAVSGQLSAALQQYEVCRQILQDELGIAPAEETDDLYKAIRTGKLQSAATTTSSFPSALAPALPRHNLPVQTTPFIGRERELADLNRLLTDPACRLVTILAPGGMGKTRLALAAAKNHLETDQDRVCFVELAPLTGGEEIVQAIADAAGFPFQQDTRSPEQQLLDYLREKPLLLVLDNFEHLLARVDLIHAILQTAPLVKVLVTSRERLHLSAETMLALDGLAFPQGEQPDDAHNYDAVKLFMQSAQRIRPQFTMGDDDRTYVAQICRLVQGMPLGILLAAAWVDLLSPREIAAEIGHSLDFLETELRDVPERQHSIRAVFEHAWRRLGQAERTVFMKLSVFRGGFTRDAAQVVAGATLKILSVLFNKSLLQRQDNGRYTIHELLRQYAEAELAAIDAGETTRDAHCAYFADFMHRREPDLKGHRQKAAIDEIEADIENVRRAWNWAVEHMRIGQLGRAIESLGLVLEWFGRYQEGEAAFARAAEKLTAIETGQGQRLLVNTLVWQAKLGIVLGRHEQTQQLLGQSMALLGAPALITQDTRSERAAILIYQGRIAEKIGNYQAAERHYEHGLALYRALDDRRGAARSLLRLQSMGGKRLVAGDPSQYQQQMEASKRLVLASLAIFRELGDDAALAEALSILGVVYWTLGQATEAQSALEESIAICNDLGLVFNHTFIIATGYLGIVKGDLGLYKQMQVQGEAALSLAREIGDSQGIYLGLFVTGCAAAAEGAYLRAQQLFQEAVALSRNPRYANNLVYLLACLGYTTFHLGNVDEARQQLEALQIALEARILRSTPYALLLAALLLADQGDIERAIELTALVWCFPYMANSRWVEDVAGKYLTAAAATLPPEVVAAAQARGQARDLWATIEEILAMFAQEKPLGDN